MKRAAYTVLGLFGVVAITAALWPFMLKNLVSPRQSFDLAISSSEPSPKSCTVEAPPIVVHLHMFQYDDEDQVQ